MRDVRGASSWRSCRGVSGRGLHPECRGSACRRPRGRRAASDPVLNTWPCSGGEWTGGRSGLGVGAVSLLLAVLVSERRGADPGLVQNVGGRWPFPGLASSSAAAPQFSLFGDLGFYLSPIISPLSTEEVGWPDAQDKPFELQVHRGRGFPTPHGSKLRRQLRAHGHGGGCFSWVSQNPRPPREQLREHERVPHRFRRRGRAGAAELGLPFPPCPMQAQGRFISGAL